jgi:hypothetical protein
VGGIDAVATGGVRRYGWHGNLFEALSVVALALVPAFLCGRFTASRFPHFTYSGRWIWALPSVLMVVTLLAAVFNSKLKLDIMELFFPPPEGEAWWAVLVFTYPTLGCVGYSLGMRSEAGNASEGRSG